MGTVGPEHKFTVKVLDAKGAELGEEEGSPREALANCFALGQVSLSVDELCGVNKGQGSTEVERTFQLEPVAGPCAERYPKGELTLRCTYESKDSLPSKPTICVVGTFWACRSHAFEPTSAHTEDIAEYSGQWRPPCDGTLHVTLVEGFDLLAADSDGTSDPFVVLKLGLGKKPGKRKEHNLASSKVKRSTLNPIWDESFTFEIEEEDDEADVQLELNVYDKDGMGVVPGKHRGTHSEFIGSATVDLAAKFRTNWIGTAEDNHVLDERLVLSDPAGHVDENDVRRRRTQTEGTEAAKKRALGQELTVKEESYLDARERFPFGRIRIKYTFETVADDNSQFARSPSSLIRQRSVSAEAYVR